MFGPDALRQGGLLMVPLLLLSIAVLSAGMERLMHWIRWKKEQPGMIRMFRSELEDLGSVEASQRVDQLLRRLNRRFSRWEPSLDLAMVLAPLLGLLSTVLGLMKLLEVLGPELVLPRTDGLMTRYGQMLVGTALGLAVAAIALVVQRLNRMQRRAVISRLREVLLEV